MTTEHTTKAPILKVENAAISYETRYGDVEAVRDVSFQVHRAKTFGVVGESGCGKSTVAFGIVDFLGANGKIVGGSIKFQGRELVGRTQAELRKLRGDQISMVYQDPMQALNPSLTIGDQLAEVLTVHRGISKDEAWQKSIDMLERVYMPDAANVMDRYPHQISGGQQQRVVIAMALLNNPALLIMDEPTTALDVTVEAVVLDLIEDLKRDFDTAIVYITHDLGVVARVCNEVGSCTPVRWSRWARSRRSTTTSASLHAGVDALRAQAGRHQGGQHPLSHPRDGCQPQGPAQGRLHFRPRCDYATDRCYSEKPRLRENSKPATCARCIYAEKIDAEAWEPPKAWYQRSRPSEEEERSPIIQLNKDSRPTTSRNPNRSSAWSAWRRKLYVKAVDEREPEGPPGKTLGVVGNRAAAKAPWPRRSSAWKRPRVEKQNF